MNKAILIGLLGCLCLLQARAQSQELQNFIYVEGNNLQLSEEKIFKYENGQNYALHNGEFYLIHRKEFNRPGPVSINFYIKKQDGSEYSLSTEYIKALRKSSAAQTGSSRIISFQEYSDTKPFIRYTSPKSGKHYKFYDVKVTPEGRIIPEEEFQSYRGNYGYVKRIKGGDYAMDTSVINPPTAASMKAIEDHKKNFAAQVGNPIKAFQTVDLEGQPIESSDLVGKVLVMNFWFIACPPCQKEIPDLNLIKKEYEGRDDIVFLGFATDTSEKLRKFLEGKQFNFQIIPRSMDIANNYLVSAYPTNFVVDKTGNVIYAHTGLNEHTIDEIRSAIKKALN